jgi:PAS domain S-box-containing protein
MAVVQPQEHAAVLDESGHWYRLIAESIPLMVWSARANGEVDLVNSRTLEYTGLEAHALQGWQWECIVHPDDRQRCAEAWRQALANGEPSQNDMRLRRADGEYHWHRGSGVPLRDAEGRIVRWIGICTEIETNERMRTMRAAQSRMRALIDNEPECVKLLDAQGRVLEMNTAGLRMLEADAPDAVLGHCVYGLIAPEHVAVFRDLTERVCRGERGTLEFEVIGFKGGRRWLETHAAPFLDEASGETRLLAITRDVTERRRAEQALRESEQRFQLFMDNLPANAWIRGADFRYSYVNRRYAQTWANGEPAALLGRSAAELFAPEVAAYFHDSDQKVRAQGAATQYVDNEPSGRWLKVKFPVPDGRGGVGVGGVAVDITERSRLEEALAESEQRFRLFMDNAPARVWTKDARLRYTYVNRTFEQFHGLAAKDVLGRDDTELFEAEVAGFFRTDDEEVLKAGRAVEKLRQLPGGEGRMGHWLLVKFPLADAAGGAGIGGFAMDVTARVAAEAKAQRYAEDARDLASRLVQAQEAERRRVADELHDLIGQNLTALGIDLQALKQRLQGGGDLISGPRLDAMASLLDTTIDAIRGVMTELRPVALEEFGLVPALRWYASQFSARTGMKVRTNAPRHEARLPRDTELALFRIVQEALTNAAKHSGGSAVELSLAKVEGRLRLSIEDNGRGFAHAADKRAGSGGFGLPTMRERAEAVGGALRVESPERGTRVVVEVPASAP